jgi:hypothetical protein
MRAWWAAIVVFCGGAVWAAAPPPTLQMMMTPSAQRTARYEAYLAVSRMLDSGQPEAALSKLKALEKQDSQNALPLYLRAYAQFLGGASEKALASVVAGNGRPYLITYLDAEAAFATGVPTDIYVFHRRGWLYSAMLPHLKCLRALVRGLVSYAEGLPVQKRVQALRTLSAMASKTLTGRPFIIITTLVGMALHRMVDTQLDPAYSEAGDAKGAAAVRDRQSRLERLRSVLKERLDRLHEAAGPEARAALKQDNQALREALVSLALGEERVVRDALKETGFLPR